MYMYMYMCVYSGHYIILFMLDLLFDGTYCKYSLSSCRCIVTVYS